MAAASIDRNGICPPSTTIDRAGCSGSATISDDPRILSATGDSVNTPATPITANRIGLRQAYSLVRITPCTYALWRRSLCDPCVHHVRIQVSAVGPMDRAE